MHLYILIRGIKNFVDQFITELQGKYLPFEFPNPVTKKLETGFVQVSVRPIQLWEIVYPETSNDLMLSTILDMTDGKTQHKKHNKFVYLLRKILGCKPIPEYNKDNFMPLQKGHMERVAIGIKKDYWIDNKTGLHHDTKINDDCYEGL